VVARGRVEASHKTRCPGASACTQVQFRASQGRLSATFSMPPDR